LRLGTAACAVANLAEPVPAIRVRRGLLAGAVCPVLLRLSLAPSILALSASPAVEPVCLMAGCFRSWRHGIFAASPHR